MSQPKDDPNKPAAPEDYRPAQPGYPQAGAQQGWPQGGAGQPAGAPPAAGAAPNVPPGGKPSAYAKTMIATEFDASTVIGSALEDKTMISEPGAWHPDVAAGHPPAAGQAPVPQGGYPPQAPPGAPPPGAPYGQQSPAASGAGIRRDAASLPGALPGQQPYPQQGYGAWDAAWAARAYGPPGQPGFAPGMPGQPGYGPPQQQQGYGPPPGQPGYGQQPQGWGPPNGYAPQAGGMPGEQPPAKSSSKVPIIIGVIAVLVVALRDGDTGGRWRCTRHRCGSHRSAPVVIQRSRPLLRPPNPVAARWWCAPPVAYRPPVVPVPTNTATPPVQQNPPSAQTNTANGTAANGTATDAGSGTQQNQGTTQAANSNSNTNGSSGTQSNSNDDTRRR